MTDPSLNKPSAAFDKTARHLMTVTSTLLMLSGVGLLIYHFYSLTALLGIVLIVTYLLLGPVNLMEKGISALSSLSGKIPGYGKLLKKSPEANPRILAVLLVYAFFFITLTVSTVQFLPILRSQVGEMGQKIGVQLLDASEAAIDWADKNIGKGTFRRLFAQDISQAELKGIIKSHVETGRPMTAEEKKVIQQTVIQNAVTQLENSLTSAVPNFISLVGGTLNGFIYFLAGLLLTFFLLVDSHKIRDDMLAFFPERMRDTTSYLLESFHQVMFAFIKGQVLLGLLTGGYMFIIYSVFNVPFAFLLGCIFALAELLPLVGTWIGITIGLAVILLTMEPVTALWIWLCSYAYQTIKDNILAPKVVGDVMGLHPMVIILALLICAQVAGLLGVLIALPLASAINVIIRLLLQKDSHEKRIITEGGPHA